MDYIKRFGFALTFLTRIPFSLNIEYDDSLPSRSMGLYPLVGLMIGLILVFFDLVFSSILPVRVINILLLILLVYLTGGLHLDGFIDSIDGLFSCREKERVLEIMHDSLVGSFGVIAIILLFFLKYTLLIELSGEMRWYGLILMPVISRWMIVFAAWKYPLAVSSSLGKGFNYQLGWKQIIEASFYLVAVVLFNYLFFSSVILISLTIFFFCLLVTHLIARKVINQIDGLTGDIYGAVNEIIEVFVLFLFVIL